MRADLHKEEYKTIAEYEEYIYGSADGWVNVPKSFC